MVKARLIPISALLLVVACRDANAPTRISSPPDPGKVISDGAHCATTGPIVCNPDFFFLPPLVSDPSGNANYEPGQFNPTLGSALTVEICQLQTSPIDASGQPVTTDCVAGPPVKKFLPGTITLQNPPDGFYQVVWHVSESNLDATKFYRIKVLADGSSTPFGVADVDPVLNMKELRNARTGEVIPLNENSTLPIKFRIEHGGGSALCGDASLCVSTTISNSSPTGFQTVTVDGGGGAIAGVKFPNGWLPADGPQNVVVTIAQVDIGTTDPVSGASTRPCHVGLPLQQFPGCFNFTTTPRLEPIDESGRQFATDVTVAVCYSLEGSGDPRENFAEMYASGPDEPPHALPEASDAGLLSAATRDCSTTPVIGEAQSRTLTRFASHSWRRIRSGVGALFGVKTAYGVDLGLGGIATAFSNIGPALNGTIAAVGSTEITLTGGGDVSPFVRIVGSNHHDGQHQNSIGIGGLPVQFTITQGAGATLSPQGQTGGTATTLDAVTNRLPIDIESSTSGGGYASVNMHVPSTPDTYQLSVTGAALGGPVVFTVTVTPPADLTIPSTTPSLSPSAVSTSGGTVTLSGWTIANAGGPYSLDGVESNGFYISTDPVITASDTRLDGNVNGTELQAAGGKFDWGARTLRIPALSAGTYYVGILIDEANNVAESNETNNYVSIPVVVLPENTGSWTAKASMPGGFFLTSHSAALSNGKIYAIGAQTGPPYTVHVNEYDPSSGTWTQRGTLLRPRDKFSLAVVNDIIYVIGGEPPGIPQQILEVEAYDPSTGISTDVTTMPLQQVESSVGVVNGVIYVVGGYTIDPTTHGATLVSTVQAYDPQTNSWSTKQPLPTKRYALGVASVGGLLYAVGGYDFSSQTHATVEAYNPQTNTWSAKRPLQKRRALGGVAASGGRIYAVGGWNQTDSWMASAEYYDPAYDQWIYVNPMQAERGEFGFSAANGALYVIAGRNATSWLNSVVAFQP
ncbi:MAG TPA: kelch repeat-containing protein [Gemmatimonadaceae bacterium]|nr:kelch repeat-containing protein [Gemmatimonadaceae bacterium]